MKKYTWKCDVISSEHELRICMIFYKELAWLYKENLLLFYGGGDGGRDHIMNRLKSAAAQIPVTDSWFGRTEFFRIVKSLFLVLF